MANSFIRDIQMQNIVRRNVDGKRKKEQMAIEAERVNMECFMIHQ